MKRLVATYFTIVGGIGFLDITSGSEMAGVVTFLTAAVMAVPLSLAFLWLEDE